MRLRRSDFFRFTVIQESLLSFAFFQFTWVLARVLGGLFLVLLILESSLGPSYFYYFNWIVIPSFGLSPPIRAPFECSNVWADFYSVELISVSITSVSSYSLYDYLILSVVLLLPLAIESKLCTWSWVDYVSDIKGIKIIPERLDSDLKKTNDNRRFNLKKEMIVSLLTY
jgi:hypothetical protein